MCEWKMDKQYCRRASFAWQALALALLLLPITAQFANGQLTVTVTILSGQVGDTPQSAEPSEPQIEQSQETPANTDAIASEVAVAQESAQSQHSAEPSQTSAGVPAAEALPIESANEGLEALQSQQAVNSSETQQTAPLEKQLSVEPTATLLPADRPAWITNERDLKSETHRFVVSSFPTARSSEVDSNLDSSLEEATRNYVNELLGDDRAGDLLASHLSSAFVRTNLLDDKTSYIAELTTTGGVMFQKWVQVEVTKEQQEQIRTWYQQQIQRQRIVPLGVGLVAMLGFVGVCNMYFRRSANKSQQQVVLNVLTEPEAKACCGKRGSWGYAFAIAVAIAVAIFVTNS